MSVRIMSMKLSRLLLLGAIALAALIILVIGAVKLFGGGSSVSGAEYYPGTYTTTVALGTGQVTVEMVFSEEGIESVHYEIPEEVQKVYPLVQTAASSIGQQLSEGTGLDAVQVDSASSETARHLLNAMKLTEEKARVQ